DECLSLMRKRDPQQMEDGFHWLQARACEHLPRLLEAFESEQSLPTRRWLLELIADARSDDAFDVLCEQALSTDEGLRLWAVHGLELLDTKAARRLLFEHGLKRERPGPADRRAHPIE